MKLKDIHTINDIETIYECDSNREIKGAYTSDILSDVLHHALPDSVLITIQAHINTIAVAVHKNLSAVIICHGMDIPDDMIKAAKEHCIPLYVTKIDQFHTSIEINEILQI